MSMYGSSKLRYDPGKSSLHRLPVNLNIEEDGRHRKVARSPTA
jgi:hypothetical protein